MLFASSQEDDESLMMEEMLLASKDGKLDSIQNMLHVNPDLDFINYRDSEVCIVRPKKIYLCLG